jgi:hypothetical protein
MSLCCPIIDLATFSKQVAALSLTKRDVTLTLFLALTPTLTLTLTLTLRCVTVCIEYWHRTFRRPGTRPFVLHDSGHARVHPQTHPKPHSNPTPQPASFSSLQTNPFFLFLWSPLTLTLILTLIQTLIQTLTLTLTLIALTLTLPLTHQSGAGAEDGMAVSMYEWSAALLLILLGWVFAPIYLSAGVTTVPEFLETRFNKWVRLGMAVITIIAYAATKISASIFGGYIVLNSLLGLDLYTSVISVILATGLYTMVGGLNAVVLTDTLQLFIFLLGGVAGACLAMSKVGGLDGLHDAIVANPGIPDDFLHPLRSVDDKDYPLIGMFVGMPLSSCWYWCMDQELVQRVLCSRDLRSARAGILMAGYLKILPPFMMVLPKP